MPRPLLVRCVLFVSLAGVALPGMAVAQISPAFDASIHVVSARIGELDANDVGVSGRLGWRPGSLLGIEAELGFFPSDLVEPRALTASRTEVLVGITAGPRIGRFRPFVRVRPGWLKIGAAPQPVACILIFPPPLACTIAGGPTLFVTDLGAGAEFDVTSGTFLRVDVGDRLTRYQGPASSRGAVYDNAFIKHDLRVAAGAGWRF